MSTSDPVTELVETVKEGWQEAKAEEARRNRLLAYWCKLFENFSYSPQAFYTLVERNLASRKVPVLETDYLLIHQSGMFSPKRLYLHFRRERLVFEICAASFGSGFFVSSRLFDRRREANVFHLLLFTGLIVICGALVWQRYGWVWGMIIATGIVASIWSLMRVAATETVLWLDRTLPEVPLLGPIYERLFHPDTYYRQDVGNCYREAVHHSVMQSIDEMRAERGLRPLGDDERRPILRELSDR